MFASTHGKLHVSVDDDRFQVALRREMSDWKIRSERDLVRVGLQVQNYARELCPVDTGRLRASIQMDSGRDGVGPWVSIGTNVEYAPYVEFGTRYMSPQPYMRPAVLMARVWWAATT
jgi:HK97 gp10 family phage protein